MQKIFLLSACQAYADGGTMRVDRKMYDGAAAFSACPGLQIELVNEIGTFSTPPNYYVDVASLAANAALNLRFTDRSADYLWANISAGDLVFLTADCPSHITIAEECVRRGVPYFLIIEYTLMTRLQIARAEAPSLPRLIKTCAWHLGEEIRIRRALRQAKGVQFNGYPAYDLYGRLTRNGLLYFDGRIEESDLIVEGAIAGRLGKRTSADALRLVVSGRIERMKGAHYVVPLCRALRERGVHFTLDVFGDGSLRSQISQAVAENGLSDMVRIHGAVDFDGVLMPRMRDQTDLFVCLHPQGDPACTYLEAMGAGLPIAGFANASLRAFVERHGVGWSVPIGNIGQLAAEIARIASSHEELARKTWSAAAYGRDHAFRAEFVRRAQHLLAEASIAK